MPADEQTETPRLVHRLDADTSYVDNILDRFISIPYNLPPLFIYTVHACSFTVV